jgi:hypothetical protein
MSQTDCYYEAVLRRTLVRSVRYAASIKLTLAKPLHIIKAKAKEVISLY